MTPFLLEVIVQSVADAREAARGGADRLEVVRALEDGGLTPARALVRDIADAVDLPLRVMVRGNAGYDTNAAEVLEMRDAAAAFAGQGIDGLVIGFARGGRLDLEPLVDVLRSAPKVNVTLHRAFDQLFDPFAALSAIAAVPQIDRILTSGVSAAASSSSTTDASSPISPQERCTRLRQYQERAGARITILAGGGVDDEILAELVKVRPVREVHIGRAGREGQSLMGAVSAAMVRRVRDALGAD